MREGLAERPWEKSQGQIYLGREDFIEKHGKGAEEIREVSRAQRRVMRATLEQIFRRHGDEAIEEAIEVAYREHGYRMREMAEHLGVHYATVS